MCFGPGEQRVRLAGSETNKPDFALQGKAVKDLWDEENVVPPMALNVRSDASHGGQQRKMHDHMAQVAAGMEM